MNRTSRTAPLLTLAFALLASLAHPAHAQEGEQWVVYEGGGDGPGKGKHIVLVGGDEEYRSEESLPQLGKILAKHHGFKCTVLFAIDPKTGEIDPEVVDNIPGLEALKTADLMVIATRFRNLPDEQMKHVVDYLDSGKPVVGLRTATHAFNIPDAKATYAKYGWKYAGKDYEKGFGKQVLGETWVAHHGKHGSQSTRGIIAARRQGPPHPPRHQGRRHLGPDATSTPSPSPCPATASRVVLGQVLEGMKPDDKPAEGEKNNPMMPVAWTKTYKGKDGKTRPRVHDDDGRRDGPGRRGHAPDGRQRRLLGARHGRADPRRRHERRPRRRVQADAVRLQAVQEGRAAGRAQDVNRGTAQSESSCRMLERAT